MTLLQIDLLGESDGRQERGGRSHQAPESAEKLSGHRITPLVPLVRQASGG
jgi:hypothetical protein